MFDNSRHPASLRETDRTVLAGSVPHSDTVGCTAASVQRLPIRLRISDCRCAVVVQWISSISRLWRLLVIAALCKGSAIRGSIALAATISRAELEVYDIGARQGLQDLEKVCDIRHGGLWASYVSVWDVAGDQGAHQEC